MLLEEFDMDEYIKMERRDSYADGHEDGLAEGNRLYQLHTIHTVRNMFQKAGIMKNKHGKTVHQRKQRVQTESWR